MVGQVLCMSWWDWRKGLKMWLKERREPDGLAKAFQTDLVDTRKSLQLWCFVCCDYSSSIMCYL